MREGDTGQRSSCGDHEGSRQEASDVDFLLSPVMSAVLSAWNLGRTQLFVQRRPHQDFPARCWRWLSTTTLHPSINGFTTQLCEKQPVFAVPPNQIQVLSQPKDFYALLLVSLELLGNRKRRG